MPTYKVIAKRFKTLDFYSGLSIEEAEYRKSKLEKEGFVCTIEIQKELKKSKF